MDGDEDDRWEYVESALGCVLRFVFYVVCVVIVIAVALAVFVILLQWFTSAVSER